MSKFRLFVLVAREELIAQLPPEQQSADQLESTLRSAQLQQAMSSLTHAVSQPENFHGIASNFNLDPSISTEQLVSRTSVFLSSLTHNFLA